MSKTIIAAAAALLISAGVTLAQPPGITPEMINRSLPLEGSPWPARTRSPRKAPSVHPDFTYIVRRHSMHFRRRTRCP